MKQSLINWKPSIKKETKPETMKHKHHITVEREEEVAAVHHEADSDRWIFFCHGFGSNKEGSYERRSERAVEEGWNAVRFDFRGNGESDGEFIEQILSSKIKDLEAVIEFFDPERYVTFGMSFGGKVVFHHAVDGRPEAVVGKSPVTYNEVMDKFRAVVEEKGSYTHFGDKTIDQRFVEDLESYSFEEVTDKLETPVIFFHGRADTTVHPEYTWRAAENLKEDTGVRMFKGEKHSFSESAENSMMDEMVGWLYNNGF